MKKRNLLTVYRQNQSAIRLLEEIAEAPDGDTAWSGLEHLCLDVGFDICGTGVIASPDDVVSIGLTHGTPFYSNTFRQYTDRGLHLVDPVSDSIAKGARFIDAEEALLNAPSALKQGATEVKNLLATRHYSGHGILRVEMPGRPYAGWFGFALNKGQSSAEQQELSEQHKSLLRLAATVYTSVVLRQFGSSINTRIITPREAHVLTRLAKGMSPQEIAEDEGRSLATIRSQIASARRRLGARSPIHAVALALQLGLIQT